MDSAQSGSRQQLARPLALRDECLVWREVDDEVIVLDRRNWTYMGINGSGAILFKAMAQRTTLGTLVELLKDEFGIAAGESQRDVETFIAMLDDHDLLADDA